MRKTFLTFCAAALALLAVSSCGKLEDGLNSLKGEVADLKDRVEKLEKKLNDEVQALQTTMATLATKQEMNTALANLQTSLQNKDSELATAIQTVSSTLAGLDAKYVGKSVYDAAMAELADADSDFAEALEALAALLGETEAPVDELLAELAEAIASVTVTVVENEDGNVVITLANGESFTVADPDSNANNTGLVTVDEDGNWAVILEDGTLKSLDAQVGVEELEFQVDPETKELLYSVNGGEFEGTGAFASDAENTVVTDCYEEGDFFYICVGGVEYALVKATTSTTDLNLLAGKTYFENGQTKVVNFTVTDVKSAFVASAPKGWDVELDFAKRTITVTAPAEGTSEGNVEVWLLGNDGVVKAAFLPVVCGPAVITIDVDPQTNAVSMTFNKMMIEDYDGSVAMRTPEVYYGATLASEFPTKKAEYLANLAQLVWDPTSGVYTNCNSGNPDNYDLRATSFEGNVADLAYNVNYNAEYVVWAFIPVWTEDWDVANPNDFVLVYHQMNAVNFEAVADVVDVDLSIEFLDTKAAGFYGFYVSQENDWVLQGLEKGEWPMDMILSGQASDMVPCTMYEGLAADIKLSELGWSEEWIVEGGKSMILPLSKAWACFVPVYEGKELSDYTFDDVIVKEVATRNDLEFGSTVDVAYTEEKDFVTFTLNITAPADLLYAAYYIYSAGEEVPTTEEEILENLPYFYSFEEFTRGTYNGTLKLFKEAEYGEKPGRDFEVLLFLVDADGKMKVEMINTNTKSIPMNDELSLSIKLGKDDLDKVAVADFALEGEGAVKMYYTINIANPTGWSFDPNTYLIAVCNNDVEDWIEVDLTEVEMNEGAFTLKGVEVVKDSYGVRKNYLHAILVDEDGNLAGVFSSNMLEVPVGGLYPATE